MKRLSRENLLSKITIRKEQGAQKSVQQNIKKKKEEKQYKKRLN